MTKKDTIILAVLFNVVILAGVLATARQLTWTPQGPAKESRPGEVQGEEKEIAEVSPVQEEGGVAFDEIDQLLEEYISEEPPAPLPGNKVKPPVSKSTKTAAKAPKSDEPSDTFYVVKAGDNPWKIAKKFHLSFEKLLQLNHLDEAKARNLKIGQKLRIRE